MKILVVSPPTFGAHPGAAAKDTFANVELLTSLGHEVHFYAIGTAAQDQKLIDQFSASHRVPVHIFMPRLQDWFAWLQFVFKNFAYIDRASYVFGQLTQDKDFNEFVAQWKPDALLFFCSYGWPMAQFAAQNQIPSIFRSHNYEASFFWEALSRSEKLYPSNWLRYIGKVLGERNAIHYSTATATLPFEEIYKYRRWKPSAIFVHTLAFPHEGLRSAWVHQSKKPLDVFYLGASYLVSFHLRGARALIEDIAPEVLKRAPGEFVFHICGSKLPQELQQKCDGQGIVYENYVQDFDEFLNRMDVGAFPVWTGKVMKGKVFESLCRAFPVVIPRNCLGGYDLTDRREIMLAETPNEFVEALLALRDDTLRLKLSTEAATFSQGHFSKEALLKNMKDIIAKSVN